LVSVAKALVLVCCCDGEGYCYDGEDYCWNIHGCKAIDTLAPVQELAVIQMSPPYPLAMVLVMGDDGADMVLAMGDDGVMGDDGAGLVLVLVWVLESEMVTNHRLSQTSPGID